MSIRHAVLALLQSGPRYGYQLRAEFEERTGGTWPLNVGQVYTTLTRLERDGLVQETGTDDEGHVFYRLTDAGHAAVSRWFESPVPREAPPRDELAIKLTMALETPGVDVTRIIQQQRSATVAALQDYTRLKRAAAQREDLAAFSWGLVLDSLVFAAEAEVRWLDHVEARLRRRGSAEARRTDASNGVDDAAAAERSRA